MLVLRCWSSLALPAQNAVLEPVGDPPVALPDYLEKTYWWAYLRPTSIRIFDHGAVVSAILWGQYRKLSNMALGQISRSDRVLQLACVYGDLSARLARKVGAKGALDIIDIAPIQVANARRKIADMPWARVNVADAAQPRATDFDCVLTFFLLHELPDPLKRRVVDAALSAVGPRGKAVFVDYARPARWHPMRPVIAAVFALLEPYARAMWETPIAELASNPQDFSWQRKTRLAGLYQIVIAERF